DPFVFSSGFIQSTNSVLFIGGGLRNSGIITSAAPATLRVGLLTNVAGALYTGAGTNDGTLVNLLGGTAEATNGAFVFTRAPINQGTLLAQSSGTLQVLGAWANAGTLGVLGGTVESGNLTNNLTVTGFGTI